MMNNDSNQILDDLLSRLTRKGGKTFYVYTHARPDGSVFYVGKGVGDRARDFWQRSEHHKRIIRKHGEANIRVMAYAVVDERHAYAAERHLILAMRRAGLKLANVDDGGNGRIGFVMTPEHREKLSAAGMGHAVRETTRQKISEAGKGRTATEATKAKLRAKKLSDEHKAALIAAITGRPVSEESRAKARAKMQGRKLTEEHRKKLSESHRGKKHDPSTREARSAALKAAWARRKAEGARDEK